MQQLSLFISAHEDGSVKGCTYTRGDGETARTVVLQIPRYLDIRVTDLACALTAQGGAYWVISYASLCGIEWDDHEAVDELMDGIAQRNWLWDGQGTLTELAVDWERF